MLYNFLSQRRPAMCAGSQLAARSYSAFPKKIGRTLRLSRALNGCVILVKK